MANLSGIEVDASTVSMTIEGLNRTERTLKASLQIVCDAAAKKMEAWAKQNAPWTDRTGNARQGLRGEAFWEDDKNLVCAVMHQKDYGVWLELAHQRKYAILERAIESKKDELIRAYKQLVGDV